MEHYRDRVRSPGAIAVGALFGLGGALFILAMLSTAMTIAGSESLPQAAGHNVARVALRTPPASTIEDTSPIEWESPALPAAIAVTPALEAQFAASSPSSGAPTLTEHPTHDVVMIEGVPSGRQSRALNCEFQSARDLAEFYGLKLTWQEIFKRVGVDPNGNPNVGFVGRSFDDASTGLYPAGYGVYAEPIARGLAALGLPARAFKRVDAAWLRREIAAGRPVIVWATVDMRLAPIEGWYTEDGKMWVDAVRGEHTFTVVGYDQRGVLVNDPLDGSRKHYAWEQFLKSWALLGNMAVSVRP
jgi:uncharacterized protein YvpB